MADEWHVSAPQTPFVRALEVRLTICDGNSAAYYTKIARNRYTAFSAGPLVCTVALTGFRFVDHYETALTKRVRWV